MVFVIAEIGQAHDGSLGILHSYIDAVAQTGVDAIKFQTHIAEAESSCFEPFRIKFSYEDDTRYDYWQRMSMSQAQWAQLKSHCEAVGLEFMSSPFSCAAVDLLESIGMQRYKIASGEVTNHLMLQKIAATGKEVILSSGLSDFKELDEAIDIFAANNNQVSLLQCVTQYPTKAQDVGLPVMQALKQRYRVPVGLSDHSGKVWPAIAATALGAEVVEVHAVFDRRMFGPDAVASLEIDELTQLVEGVRFVEVAMATQPEKVIDSQQVALKNMFEKSLAINTDKQVGERIVLSDLEAKKPAGRGISARDYQQVVGKALTREVKRWDFLQQDDVD